MRRFLSLLLVALMFLWPSVARSVMLVRQYNPARHYRFYSGGDKAFVGGRYDFSGVGICSAGTWATLVSDNCFLSSLHRHPAVGAKVTFWASNVLAGPSYTYTVAGGARVGTTDLWVGWFDRSVSVDASIERYPVPVLPASNTYLGLELYNYGVNHRLGRNVLDRFDLMKIGGSRAFIIWYDYDGRDLPLAGGDEAWLGPGDSGGPTFAVFNSGLALIGIHWAKTHRPAGSTDTFVPEYYDDISRVLAGRGQSLHRSWELK